MTVELDNVIKNLDGRSLEIEFEVDGDVIDMYIGTDNASGCGYRIQSVQDIAENVQHYLMNYFTD